MKRKLPLSTARTIFVSSILLLSIMGFFNRWLICQFPFGVTLLEFGVPVAAGAVLYKLEYRYRFLEKIFMFLKEGRIYYVTLPLILGSLAVLLNHQDQVLGSYLPLSFLLCVCTAEAEAHDNFHQHLRAILLQIPVFLGLSLYLCYNAASAIAIIVLSLIVLTRILIYHTHCEKDVWTAIIGITGTLLLTCACLPEVLDRLLFLAVTEEDFNVYTACMELYSSAGRWCSPAEFQIASTTDLFLHYDLGYLAAKFGWISTLPILTAVIIMLISGGLLCTGLRRPMTTLGVGSLNLLTLRVLSYLAKSVSIQVALGSGLPFFNGSIIDIVLAVILIQPLNPKPLLELTPQEPDDMQEVAALLLLPRNLDGAAQLAHYVYNTENQVAWQVLLRDYLKEGMFGANDARILLLNASEVFHTQEYLREQKPQYFLLSSGKDDPRIPPELKTACYDNSFLDAPYTYQSEGVTLLRYWGSRKTPLLVPPFYTAIGPRAFENREIEIISIPNIVSSLEYAAFKDCKYLHTIELRTGLKEIHPFVFSGCTELKSIALPDTLHILENDAFAGSALTAITIPRLVKTISPYTFSHTPLKEVTLLGATRIEEGAFKCCTQLTSICLPDSLEYIAPNAFDGCSNTIEIIASQEWKARHPDLIHRITKSCQAAEPQEVIV